MLYKTGYITRAMFSPPSRNLYTQLIPNAEPPHAKRRRSCTKRHSTAQRLGWCKTGLGFKPRWFRLSLDMFTSKLLFDVVWPLRVVWLPKNMFLQTAAQRTPCLPVVTCFKSDSQNLLFGMLPQQRANFNGMHQTKGDVTKCHVCP